MSQDGGRMSESSNYFPNTDLSVWLRSCKKEQTEPVTGRVAGAIPTWLKGSLVRNGPGGMSVYENQECNHLFDGPGILQKFVINDGKAWYSNRFIQSKTYKCSKVAKRIVASEFGTLAVPDPCQSIFSRFATLFTQSLDEMVSDNANISIYPFPGDDEIYCLAETPFAHKIDVESLETIKTIDAYQEVGIICHSSHPHVMKDAVYNLGQKLGPWWPHYVILQVDNEKSIVNDPQGRLSSTSSWEKSKIAANIRFRWTFSPCYMHSFGITPNYFVIVEQPLAISMLHIPKTYLLRETPATNEKQGLVSALTFYENEPTLIHIVSRHDDSIVKTFPVETFFFLHTINAFEKDSSVYVDVCCYKDPSMIDCMYRKFLENAQSMSDYAEMFRARPKRFRLDLDFISTPDCKDLIEGEQIVDIGCETPRINYENYNGQEYRYFYAISSDVDSTNPGMLIKVDTVNKSFSTWCEKYGYPSEPIFVPSPYSKGEDDGVVLSTSVYGGEPINGPNSTSLLILDAKNWHLLAKVEFQCSTVIPKCLHGWFFPKQKKPGQSFDSSG